MSAGLDSIAVMDVSRSVGDDFSTELPAMLLFDHPSIEAIAKYIISSYEGHFELGS